MKAEVVSGIAKIPRLEWNALLAPDDSPFLDWDWLSAMEQSESAVPDTGWGPASYRGARRRRRTGRRLPGLSQKPQHGRVRLRSRMVRRRRTRGHALLPQAAGRRAVYAPHRAALPGAPRIRSRRAYRGAGARPDLAMRAATALSSVHVNFCAEDEARGAVGARLHGAAGLSVPLAQRRLLQLRRLPRPSEKQAALRGAP